MTRPPQPADVAAANQFLGLRRRKPDWLTNSTATNPSPRKKRALDQQPQHSLPAHRQRPPNNTVQHPSPADSNVLPSPAPSDEPSPSAAVLPESAPRNRQTDAAQSMEGFEPASDSATTTEEAARNRPLPSDVLHAQNDTFQHTSPAISPVTSSFDVLDYQNTPVLTARPSPLSSGYQSAFPPPQQTARSTGNATPYTGPNTPLPSPQAQAGVLPAASGQRRHADPYPSPSALVAGLQNHVATITAATTTGGQANPIPDFDQARLRLLSEACQTGDMMFVHIHQCFCAWSLGDSAPLAAISLVANKAFAVLERIMMANRNLTPANRVFFACFPGLLVSAVREPVVVFINKMAANWDSLMKVVFTRGRPLLASEMICLLGCRSPIMLKLLFTTSRRSLGIPDGPMGATMDRLFAQDRYEALNSPKYQGKAVPSDWRLLEARNSSLVQQYQQCVKAWRNASQSQPHNTGNPQQQPQRFMSAQLPHDPTAGNPMPPAPSRRHSAMQAPTAAARGAPAYAVHGQGTPQTVAPSPQSQFTLPSNAVAPGYTGTSTQISGQSYGPQTFAASPSQSPRRHPAHQQLIQEYRRQSLPFVQGASPASPSFPGQPFPSQIVGGGQSSRAAQTESAEGLMRQAQIRQVQTLRAQTQQARLSTPLTFPSQPTTRAPPTRAPFSLLPPRGQVISKDNYAYDQYHQSSLEMGLHQVHLRSPVRTVRLLDAKPGSALERHYQFVSGFSVAPIFFKSDSRCTAELAFDVDDEILSRLSKPRAQEQGDSAVPVCEYEDGSLRLRLRCCKTSQTGNLANISQSEWVNMVSCWPPHIFMVMNGSTALTPRRKPQYGKDLPTELTPHIVRGTNRIKVAVATQTPSVVDHYAVAVEMIVTRSHSHLLSQILRDQITPPEKTLELIRRRLGATGPDSDDDGVAVLMGDFSIDLADPFSAVIFETPVRGVDCTHLECFDLGNWLETRDRKPRLRECTSHRGGCNDTCRWRVHEPTLVDKWRCPICSKDARPCSLVVDGFLLDVRRKLEVQGRLGARVLHVSADGSWRPVPDGDDDDVDDGSGSDGDALHRKAPQSGGVFTGGAQRWSRIKGKQGVASSPAVDSAFPPVRSLHPAPDVIDLT